MIVELEVQRIIFDAELPTDEQFEHWVTMALEAAGRDQNTQLAIRIVDEEEGQKLNFQWRHKEGATNVLSFAMSGLELIAPELIGDIVICAPVVKVEAQQQGKALHDHWAHMTIHGVLHLLGYDHTEVADAEKMESLEVTIFDQLGLTNPYYYNKPNMS